MGFLFSQGRWDDVIDRYADAVGNHQSKPHRQCKKKLQIFSNLNNRNIEIYKIIYMRVFCVSTREEKRTNRCGEWGKRSLIELKIP